MNAEEDLVREPESAAPGAVLAAARATEKLSVAEVARHLKLSVAQVEALETGEFERLPGPVFVRGFVRNYARLLKLDPEDLLRGVEPELVTQPSSPETPPSKDIPFPPPPPRRWPALALLALLVVLVLAVHEFYWSGQPMAPAGLTAPTPMPAPTAEAKREIAPTAAVPVSTDPGPVLQVPAVPDRQKVQEAASPAPTAALKEPPAPTAALKEPPAPIAALNEAPSPVSADMPAVAGHGVVRLQFDDESWVEIRDRGGNTIFSQLNARGTEKRVSGEPPLTLVIGNAHGVRVSFNNRPVDLARHTKVDVARFVLE